MRLFCDGGVKFITRIETKNETQRGKWQAPSPRETSHPQVSLDAPSLFWSPLALHVWIQRPITLGAGGWLTHFQVAFPPPSLSLAPLRDPDLGQEGVGGELSLRFSPQQTFPWLAREDTAKHALMAP